MEAGSLSGLAILIPPDNKSLKALPVDDAADNGVYILLLNTKIGSIA